MVSSLIESASLAIWDKALMENWRCFEMLERTFHDILSIKTPSLAEVPFGGKVVVLGGDLRKILPPIEGSSWTQVVYAVVTSSLSGIL